jgi:hypothetical protein
MKKSGFSFLLVFLLIGLSCRYKGNNIDSEADDKSISAPANLTISSVTGSDINLTWIDNSNNEDSFVLERDILPSFDNPTEMTISANATTYTDKPGAGNIYFYRIKAVNDATGSDYSNNVYQVFKLNIKLVFDFGVNPGSYRNIYTIWAENPTYSYHQPMRLGDKLLGLHGATIITGVGTAYWQYKYNLFSSADVDINTSPGQEIDAVSCATPSETVDHDGEGGPLETGDFITESMLKSSTPAQFTIYFEYNHSQDYNDWFSIGINSSGQPAVLYAVNVDLTDPKNIYQLKFIGWTPRYDIDSGMSATYDLPILSAGELCRETRYITHEKETGPPIGFGPEITDETNATASVGSNGIKLEILR